MRKSLLMAALAACLPMFAVDGDAAAAPLATDTQEAGAATAGEPTPESASSEKLSASPAIPVTDGADTPNDDVSAAGVGSASDTALSAKAALPEAGIAEVNASEEAAESDHKSILQKLFDDLEGIVHMGKSEIIAVVEGAKSMVKG